MIPVIGPFFDLTIRARCQMQLTRQSTPITRPVKNCRNQAHQAVLIVRSVGAGGPRIPARQKEARLGAQTGL